MFACLYLPPRANASSIVDRPSSIVQVARDFSPRVETHGDRTVTLDISGLGSLIGEPRSIGEELRRSAADAGLRVHIAVAATSTAAMLLAHARAGLTVVARGDEVKALAPLPLRVLTSPAPKAQGLEPDIEQLTRWGLKTLGDLASLPSSALSARLGQHGLRLQRWARGEEMRPVVPAGVAEQFEASLDLEWPIDGLEPLSFVLARLLEPLCERLERGDRGAVVLRVALTLVSRDLHERAIELPAPMRDARVLRTLALLDLESNPPPAAIDRVAVAVDVTEGRVLQFGLFARALPTDTLATLLARLGALMGTDRIGSPSLVDTHRPGAFTMAKFDPPRDFATSNPQSPTPNHTSTAVLRRFRSPIPARVVIEQGRPVRVTTDRRGIAGGRVERCEGPWRSSGDWWKPSSIVHRPSSIDAGRSTIDDPWNCDEWDVAFSDGTTYRISQGHNENAWFVDGLLD
ncbi:MAG TPA: DNA polymerase Y family protein [Vicinamibacterales bacterium]|nr:DNA polymerase Y family protein [Vicinamibacterales bacterium]